MVFFSLRRFSARKWVPCGCVLVLSAVFMVGMASPAMAKDDPNTPWIVTRKADNRVLPKQDTVADIEKGLADPDKNMNSGAAAKKAAEKKAAAKTTEKAAKKTVEQPASAPAAQVGEVKQVSTPVSGQAGIPDVSVDSGSVIVIVPTSATVADTRYLNLDDPRRVALDVMGVWNYSGKKEYAVGKGPLEKVVVGRHPDFLRFVLYLTKAPVPGEITPRFQIVEGGLKMTVPFAK